MLKRCRMVFLGVLILLPIIYMGGCRHAGVWLGREDIPPHADAMVLLMGGFPDRVLQAVDQWHEERADRIINKAFKKSDMPVYVGCSAGVWSSFNPDKWWRRKEDVRHALSEPVKIVSFRLVEKRKIKS